MLSLDKLGPIFSLLGTALFMVIDLYIVASIVLFIIDAVKAKKQGRKIMTRFKVMFIIAMVLEAIWIALGIYALIVFIFLLTNGPF